MLDKKYCIQLAECDGNSKDVYSFDEIEIGTWVDGKPIYRKVITGKLANDSGNGISFANVSDLKINQLINLYGNAIGKTVADHMILQTSYNRPSGLFTAVNMFYNADSENVYYNFINTNGTYSGSTAYVVLEYTKK
ncbi:hypothetical protein [Lacrimispora xylanolytica]|uniref:Uncharacterized protein n=1 Tax=Lacrimispora xylanolytica TaxID=29375 RepID=A0ABY7AAQ5_9FIRM|nr:hypothetical protein [Lacrimispora xylanolytica]WAJ23651.1 hypothetical protein OW255_19175 [Lacrimispora xylanolytica]